MADTRRFGDQLELRVYLVKPLIGSSNAVFCNEMLYILQVMECQRAPLNLSHALKRLF